MLVLRVDLEFEEPSLNTIQALVCLKLDNILDLDARWPQFLIGLYLVLINKKEAANAGWAIQGLNCKVHTCMKEPLSILTIDPKCLRKLVEMVRMSS